MCCFVLDIGFLASINNPSSQHLLTCPCSAHTMAEDSCSGEHDTSACALVRTHVLTPVSRADGLAQARARVIGEGDGGLRPAVGQ